MASEKEVLMEFLEAHAKKSEAKDMNEEKWYERHLMMGALFFATNAKIITMEEEEELYNRYFEN